MHDYWSNTIIDTFIYIEYSKNSQWQKEEYFLAQSTTPNETIRSFVKPNYLFLSVYKLFPQVVITLKLSFPFSREHLTALCIYNISYSLPYI